MNIDFNAIFEPSVQSFEVQQEVRSQIIAMMSVVEYNLTPADRWEVTISLGVKGFKLGLLTSKEVSDLGSKLLLDPRIQQVSWAKVEVDIDLDPVK